jgi:hypothetical protein
MRKYIWKYDTSTQVSEIWKITWSGQHLRKETESSNLAPTNQDNQREGGGPKLCDTGTFVTL